MKTVQNIKNTKKQEKENEKIRSLSKEVELLKRANELLQASLEDKMKESALNQQEAKVLRRDNEILCQQLNVCPEDLASVISWEGKEPFRMEKEIEGLKAQLKAKDIVIDYLKSVIAGRTPREPGSRPVGKQPIDEETKKRVRKLRNDGWKLKHISEYEGISIGAASHICKGIKGKKESK